MATMKQKILNGLLTTLWLSIGVGTIVLLVAAMQKKDAQACKGIDINIYGVSNNFFVDKNDVLKSITSISGGNPLGKAIGAFKLNVMESELQQNVWVKNAQLFFDHESVLRVNVYEREPIARIFTTTGTTFYIDSAIKMLPLSDKYSARLPVFTGFPSDRTILSAADSSLLRDIMTMSLAIQSDSFRMAMIEQVDISADRSFTLVPKLGNNTILFGDASDAENKFKKLQLFYGEVIPKAGLNKYSVINLQYKNQVVAKIKGVDDIAADSLRTLLILQQIAENASKLASDSIQIIQQDNEQNTTNPNLINESIERDEMLESSPNENAQSQVDNASVVAAPAVAPTVKPIVAPVNNSTRAPVTVKPKPMLKPPPIKPKPKPLPAKPVTKPVTKSENDY
jgi:cell division protein FtsQ